MNTLTSWVRAFAGKLHRLADDAGLPPSLEQARRFQALFDKRNAWVIKKFFPDHPEYLEPRWPKA